MVGFIHFKRLIIFIFSKEYLGNVYQVNWPNDFTLKPVDSNIAHLKFSDRQLLG